MKDLNGRIMFVSSTADNGVVGSETRLHFIQRGARVAARYAGGRITRGWLAGEWVDDTLHFRYAQREEDSAIHGGESRCQVHELPDGRLQIIEQFTWSTRLGSGVNRFDEVPGGH